MTFFCCVNRARKYNQKQTETEFAAIGEAIRASGQSGRTRIKRGEFILRHIRLISTLSLLTVVFLTGCATTRARRPETADQSSQIAALQNEIQAKDQQIQDLQYQLDNSSRSGSNFSSSRSDSGVVKASGVSVSDVQRALIRAGYDPGPVDGKAGKKTKSAIKQFQRRNNLKVDGVVGERTWALLR